MRSLSALFLLITLLSLPLPAQHYVGPDAMDLRAIAWDATNGKLYLGTSFGTVAWSKGVETRLQDIILPYVENQSLEAIAAQGDTLIVATSGPDDYRLRVSTDAGETWVECVVHGINRYGIRSVGFAGNALWVIDKSLKALTSHDLGQTWKPLIDDAGEARVNSIAAQGEEIVAGTESGLYRSTDGGLHWTAGVGGITSDVSDVVMDGQGLLAVVSASTSDDLRTILKLYRLRDRSATTSEELPFPDIDNVNRTYSHCLVQSGKTILLGVFRNYHHLIGETRLMRTDDDGKHWAACDGIDSLGRIAAVDAGGVVVLSDGMHILASYDAGVSFAPIDQELKGVAIRKTMGNSTPVVESGGFIYSYVDGTFVRATYESWSSPPYRLLAARGETILATTGNPMESYGSQIMIRSTDQGRSWNEVDRGLLVASKLYSDNRQITAPIERIGDDGERFVALSVAGVFISSDSGASWRSVDAKGWRRTSDEVMELRDVVLSGDNVFIATELGILKGSTKSGGWKRLKSWPKDHAVQSLAAAGRTIYAATDVGLLTSTDDGATWRAVKELGNTDITDVAARDNIVAVITEEEVMMSKDGGARWKEIQFPTSIHPSNLHVTFDEIWVGSTMNGGWRVPFDRK